MNTEYLFGKNSEDIEILNKQVVEEKVRNAEQDRV